MERVADEHAEHEHNPADEAAVPQQMSATAAESASMTALKVGNNFTNGMRTVAKTTPIAAPMTALINSSTFPSIPVGLTPSSALI